eukprot:246245_1
MEQKQCFITVGTTKFDLLIEILNCGDILELLHIKGFSKLTVQFGRGTVEPAQLIERARSFPDFSVEAFRFADSLDEYINRADLVISHAGAGSILETLRASKPLLVVVNQELMDNHQVELAEGLGSKGYLRWCTPETLCKTIAEFDEAKLIPFPVADKSAFPKFVDRTMGFSV